MKPLRVLAAVGVLGSIATFAPVSFAQSAEEMAAAEQLFREAKGLMQKNDYARACPKLADSAKLDPQPGTLLNLGVCYESMGKTASAYGAFAQAVVEAQRRGQKERLQFGKEKMAATDAKLSRVAINVDKPTRDQVVTVDGRPQGAGMLGTALPMDPGTHEVESTAPGKKPFKKTFTVAQGPSNQEVAVPALEDAIAAAPTPAAPVPATANPAGADTGVTSSGGGNTRTLGLVIGGIGIAGLAVGGVFGAMYLGKRSDWTSCGTKEQCETSLDGGEAGFKSSAQTLGWVSTAGFAVGVIGVAAGAYLFFTAKPNTEKTARVFPLVAPGVARDLGGRDHATVMWQGSF